MKWLLYTFEGIVMPPRKTTQISTSDRRKKSIIELLSIGHISDLFRISDSSFILPRNHTLAFLSIQAQEESADERGHHIYSLPHGKVERMEFAAQLR